ncbi:hypothetical protein BLD25_04590 [Candidatus Gracilibacteria bacterium GN02-872]|nr:hypothetical protein BLD25_04590 [Candidatus Gracilibacteria bacterium GN02-872]RKW22386.1 MAG: hypothetical protein D8B46_05480 [Candidatus Gracilibacteria bacterium]
MPNSEKKKLKTSEILFTLSGIIFILLICTTVFLLIKINVLETKFESLNEKTTKMEKDLNGVSHHLLISE